VPLGAEDERHDGERVGGPSGFSITPFEDFVTGVRYEDGTLTLRPSTPFLLMEIMGVVTGLVALAIAVTTFVNHRWLAAVVTGLIGGGSVFGSLQRLRSCAIASPERLVVRNGIRGIDIEWSRVARVGAEEVKPSGWRIGGFMPWSAAPAALSWHTTFREARPVVTLVDGAAVRCDGLVTQARSEGMSFGDPTAAEIKVGLLARYHAAVAGAVPTYVPERRSRSD
jgi:hypothetical protein